MPSKPTLRRKPTRMPGYDYTLPGGYFVTICTHQHQTLFGEVVAGEMQLNKVGEIVRECWANLPTNYPNIQLDEFVIMPDHVHGVLFILETESIVGSGLKPDPTKRYSLSEIIRGFKTFSSRKINSIYDTRGQKNWQRSFYDRIIRDDDELDQLRAYIRANPLRWQEHAANTDGN